MLKSYSSSRNAQAKAIAVPAPALISHRNLDICLLAVCSCALTVLCHQAVNLSAPTLSSPSSSNGPTLAQIDTSVKSGWFAATRQLDEDEQN